MSDSNPFEASFQCLNSKIEKMKSQKSLSSNARAFLPSHVLHDDTIQLQHNSQTIISEYKSLVDKCRENDSVTESSVMSHLWKSNEILVAAVHDLTSIVSKQSLMLQHLCVHAGIPLPGEVSGGIAGKSTVNLKLQIHEQLEEIGYAEPSACSSAPSLNLKAKSKSKRKKENVPSLVFHSDNVKKHEKKATSAKPSVTVVKPKPKSVSLNTRKTKEPSSSLNNDDSKGVRKKYAVRSAWVGPYSQTEKRVVPCFVQLTKWDPLEEEVAANSKSECYEEPKKRIISSVSNKLRGSLEDDMPPLHIDDSEEDEDKSTNEIKPKPIGKKRKCANDSPSLVEDREKAGVIVTRYGRKCKQPHSFWMP